MSQRWSESGERFIAEMLVHGTTPSTEMLVWETLRSFSQCRNIGQLNHKSFDHLCGRELRKSK
jgi:hypothetical protein